MIRESGPWKRELRRLRRALATIAAEPLEEDLADYKIEKPLLQSAIVVRRLIESWKITDVTRTRRFPLRQYLSRPDRLNSLARLTMQGDLDEEFDLDAGTDLQLDAWNITSELIHSGFINWEVDEDGRFVAIYLASMRNQSRRLLHIPIGTYLVLIDGIAADKVKSVHKFFDERGEPTIRIT